MPRLFVGVPAPASLELSGARNMLEERARGVKLVNRELYHVTLAFLGDTPDARVDDVLDALDAGSNAAAAHEGHARGLGAFPSANRASVVWAGVADTQLTALAEATRRALADRDVDFDDRHDFHAHVTLARLREKQDLSSLLVPHEDTEFGAFPVDRIHLYESTLTPDGPEYEVRGTAPLEAPA